MSRTQAAGRRAIATASLAAVMRSDPLPRDPKPAPEPDERAFLTVEQRQSRLELLAQALGPAPDRAKRRAAARAKARADKKARRSR